MCVTSRNIIDSPLPVQTNRFQVEGITQCRSPPNMRTSDFIFAPSDPKMFITLRLLHTGFRQKIY